MRLILWVASLAALLVLSVFLTHRASKEAGAWGKILRYFGILISTMPLIGFIQSAVAARMKNKLYAESCAYQALAGLVYYFTATRVLPLIG